tara:strand:+ start:145 stop:1095 length:951 start_codon:yes stop_codon:yes gene_type:complete
MSLINKKIIITGGAGFIGSHLVDKLCDQNKVTVIDNFSRGNHVNPKASIFQADLSSSDFKDYIFDGADIVFHLASSVGSYHFYEKKSLEVLVNNTKIDYNVFQSVEKYNIPKLFYASSSHVYPKSLQKTLNAAPLKEENAYPADPSLSYGWNKLSSEKYLSYCKGNFKYAIARYNGIYGPRQSTDLKNGSIIPVLIERAKKYPETEYTILTKGEEKRAFCYIDDAVEATIRMVEFLDHNDYLGPLNIGHPDPVSILDLATLIKNNINSNIKLNINNQPINPEILCQYCDCSLAKEKINWSANISLVDGLNLIINQK